MIRLKSLLTEVGSNKLNVLFVGDHQTKSNWSYAKQLIADGTVTGKIVGWTNATTAQLYRILKSNISKRYDVISIMGGDSDGKAFDANAATTNLERCYALAKKYKAKLVVISNPSKIYLTPGDKYYSDTMYPSNDIISNWVLSQSKSDATINTLEFDENAFSKDHYRLNAAANRIIANEWKSAVTAMNITPRSKKINIKSDTSLRLGDSGTKVRELQDKLIELGLHINMFETSAALFGVSTLAAVVQVQKTLRLPKTGIVTDEVMESIERMTPADTETDDTVSTDVPAGSGENATANDIINYLMSNGLSKAGAAGVAGNLYVESAGTFSTTIKGDNGTSIGLAQWHDDRWTGKNGLVAWSKQHGNDPYSIEGQLDFLLWELSGTTYRSLLDVLKTTDDPEKAAELFCKEFERPTYNQATYIKRKKHAREFFNSNAKNTEEPKTSKAYGSNGYLTAGQLKSIGGGFKLAPEAADSYLKMKQASFEDGLTEADWDLTDAYRTYDQQDAKFDWTLYNKTGKKAKIGTDGRITIAYPGTSNHGLGKAIDISGKAQDWIRTNGEQFGWSWDEGRSVGEPWHFRYKL